MSLLKTKNLCVRIGNINICNDLELDMNAGESWALLGRNGAGKSTLIHTLAGLLPAESGDIYINGKNLDNYSRKEIAKRIGVLFQTYNETFPSTVMESTLAGRHPHIDWLQWESKQDIKIAEQSLHQMDLLDLKDRDIHTLSGGEMRRTQIACLLTQNPDIALLDEPSNHLDMHHQIKVLKIFRDLLRDKLIITSLHDINIATRFCTHALLLAGDGKTISGKANKILTENNLQRLYGIDLRKISADGESWFIPRYN